MDLIQGDLIELTLHQIIHNPSYSILIVGNEEKKFPIYIECHLGKTIELYLKEIPRPRPLPHDLISSVLRGFKIRVKQVVIVELQDTVFFSRLFLEQDIEDQTHVVEVDARPSDSLGLALLTDAPLYCTPEVFQSAVSFEE